MVYDNVESLFFSCQTATHYHYMGGKIHVHVWGKYNTWKFPFGKADDKS